MGGHRRDFGFRSARIEAPLKGPERGSGLCDVRFRKILSATAFRMTCHEARAGGKGSCDIRTKTPVDWMARGGANGEAEA